MNGLIIFNSSNDVVYHKLNAALTKKISQVASLQGLLEEKETAELNTLDSNIILQIFSPLINSQKIMHCQFDNTYSSFQCDNDFNGCLSGLLGCTFLKLGQLHVDELSRQLGVAMTFARYCYGANLFGIQAGSMQQELLTQCLDCHETQLADLDQTYLVEALPKLLLNSELKRTVHLTLDITLEQLRLAGHQRAHVLLLVSNKLVAVNSARMAVPLSSADLLFLAIMSRSLPPEKSQRAVAVFLQGISHDEYSGCIPSIVHISRMHGQLVFIQVIEYATMPLTGFMYDAFFVLQKIISVQLQGDADGLRPTFETLEQFISQILIALKRHVKYKQEELGNCVKKFSARWENLRKMYNEFFKAYDRELLVRIESNVPAFLDELKQLFTLACCDSSAIQLDQLPEVAALVEGKLLEFAEFLTVKASRNISIEAYLEDFPGLVHFLYINRSTGQMLAPDLQNNQLVNKTHLRSLVRFSFSYLKKGQTTVMWKDKTFHYSYFLWFEDQSGATLKSTVDLQAHFMHNAIGNSCIGTKLPSEPGALSIDYYSDLAELCFPKLEPAKVKVYELFCIHLGLITATCAVEHARRLVATISDVVGDDKF